MKYLVMAALLLGLLLIIIAGALIWAPLGVLLAGIALIAVVTFDTSKVGSLTWPR